MYKRRQGVISIGSPVDAQYTLAAPNASLPNAFVLTNSPTITWNFSTPGIALANSVPEGLLQRAFASTGSVISTTSAIPYDDTIPQITEGAEALSITITPLSATSRIRLCAVLNLRASALLSARTMAIFRGGVANALAASSEHSDASNIGIGLGPVTCIADIASPGITAQTFSVRFGPHAAPDTLFVNADAAGTRIYGGAFASTFEVDEYVP